VQLLAELALERFDALSRNNVTAILFSWLAFLFKNTTRSMTRPVMGHRKTGVAKSRESSTSLLQMATILGERGDRSEARLQPPLCDSSRSADAAG
jgi:hypothetical protein